MRYSAWDLHQIGFLNNQEYEYFSRGPYSIKVDCEFRPKDAAVKLAVPLEDLDETDFLILKALGWQHSIIAFVPDPDNPSFETVFTKEVGELEFTTAEYYLLQNNLFDLKEHLAELTPYFRGTDSTTLHFKGLSGSQFERVMQKGFIVVDFRYTDGVGFDVYVRKGD